MSTRKFPPIGADGEALETFDSGTTGKVFIYSINPETGEAWGEVEVLARGQIREHTHVVIADGNRGCREGSPEEIKYRNTRTNKFQNADTDNPLPVTMGSRPVTYPATAIITAAGNTLLVSPSVGTKRIRVHWYSLSNRHVVLADVGLRFGALGNVTHRHALAANGGNVPANLTDANFEGALGEQLFAWAAAAYANGVLVTVGYTEED